MGNATNIVASVGGINLVKKQTSDAANRLMRSDGPAGIFTNRYYIHNGLLSTVSNLASGLHVSYNYDIMDRVESIRWQDRQGEDLFGMHYAYNAAGMITNLTLRDGSRTAYQYDSLDRLVGEKRYSATGTLVDEAGYDYDAAGNRLRKQRGSVQVNYSQPYGSQGNRLASWSATSTDAFTAARTWEISGHSSEEIGTNNLFGELWVSNTVAVTPTVAGTNFSVTALLMAPGEQSIVAAIRDTAGNMGYATNTVTTRIVTNANYTYNAAGCVTGILYRGIHYPDCQFNLAWNSQYQLTAVATNGTPVETYGYDPLGRRAWTSDGSVTNWHVYDGMHVVADLAASGTLLRSYAWGPGIDNLLAVTVYTGGTTNVYYAITDQLGTVHALADATGDIVESYLYDAWGNVLEVRDENGLLSNDNGLWYSPLGNRYLFQGREYSWTTGLYNFRARWYDPITGRWLSNDPIGISGGLNQYVAFGNNPVNFRDPSGLCPDDSYTWWDVSQRIVENRDSSWDNISTAHDWYLFSLAGGGHNGTPSLTYHQAQIFAHAVDGAMLVLPQALLNYWTLSSVFTMPARASTITVSRWGRPGLQNGDWVMQGGANRWNYIRSFKWQPGVGNQFAPYSSGAQYTVPRAAVRLPTGGGIDGAWKGVFGQRIYMP